MSRSGEMCRALSATWPRHGLFGSFAEHDHKSLGKNSHAYHIHLHTCKSCSHTRIFCNFLSKANKFIDMSSIKEFGIFVMSASNSKRCAARISALSSLSPLAEKSRGLTDCLMSRTHMIMHSHTRIYPNMPDTQDFSSGRTSRMMWSSFKKYWYSCINKS